MPPTRLTASTRAGKADSQSIKRPETVTGEVSGPTGWKYLRPPIRGSEGEAESDQAIVLRSRESALSCSPVESATFDTLSSRPPTRANPLSGFTSDDK